MATATVAATAQKVHVEVAGFAAFGEFHGSNIDCAADAELMARHPLDGSPLDAATLNLWWSEYWNTGHHTAHGATLAHVYWHLTGSAHKLDPKKARIAKYIPTDTATFAELRDAFKAALGKGQTVITLLDNASAGLAYNERGVFGHFIALGGIDSDKGYLVGNGDDVNALGGHGIIPTRWYGKNSLQAAGVNGMIALERVASVSGSSTPSGWTDDGATTLKAPNGATVVRGFRDAVMGWPGGWQADNTPRAAEYIGSDGHSRQDFRFCSLGWLNGKAVLLPIGDELASVKAQLAAAQDAPKADPIAAGWLALGNELKARLAEL